MDVRMPDITLYNIAAVFAVINVHINKRLMKHIFHL